MLYINRVTKYLLLATMLFVVACSDSEDNQIEIIADNLWEYSISNPDGFTVEIPQLSEVTEGFSVGYLVEFSNTGRASLTDIVNHALTHNSVVGGWLDVDDNIYYFDSVKIFDDTQQQQAEEFAVENQQKAYYHLTTSTTIYIEY